MSQELIPANPHILAFQAMSRKLFRVFNEGPGGLQATRFSANDPKHKEWLLKAEKAFAKHTALKPAFLEALESEPDIKSSWESSGGERGLGFMQETLNKCNAALKKHTQSPTSRRTSSATKADRDVAMGQSQSPTAKTGEESPNAMPSANASGQVPQERRLSTSQISPTVEREEDEQVTFADAELPAYHANSTPSPKAPRPTRSETAKSGSSQRLSEGSPVIDKNKTSTSSSSKLPTKRKSAEPEEVEDDFESLYPKRRKAAIRADERVANLPKLLPKSLQDTGKPGRKKPGRKPKSDLVAEASSLPSSSPPPGVAHSPEPRGAFYDLHPEYANDDLQSVFSSGVAAFQKLLDMNAQGVFKSLDTVRASMDKADENGDGFDPPTQLEQIALVFGRMEGLIQGGVMPTPD